MNDSSIYEIGVVLSIVTFLVIFILICVDIKYNKSGNLMRNIRLTVIALFSLIIAAACYTNIKLTYK